MAIHGRNWFSDREFHINITDLFGSQKSLHTLIIEPHVGENWTKSYGIIKIIRFLEKKWYTMFEKVLTPFWKRFCDINNCSIPNCKTIIFHSFTRNQVKSYFKHGRPNQSQRNLTVVLKWCVTACISFRDTLWYLTHAISCNILLVRFFFIT